MQSGDSASIEQSVADDGLLQPYSSILMDLGALEVNIDTLWRQVISLMLPDTPSQQDFEGAFTLS